MESHLVCPIHQNFGVYFESNILYTSISLDFIFFYFWTVIGQKENFIKKANPKLRKRIFEIILDFMLLDLVYYRNSPLYSFHTKSTSDGAP